MKLSVVTAVKNRPHHIAKSADVISSMDFHSEHIIVDWASNPPLQRDDLPCDNRIVLVRVNTDYPWWLAGAYNLGFSFATGDVVLKSDADILPGPGFFSSLQYNSSYADFSCGRLTSQEWMMDSSSFPSSGLFWAKRKALADVRGFNPLIYGWGWDDIDLYSRLFSAGFAAMKLASIDSTEIKHSNEARRGDLFRCSCSFDLPPQFFSELVNGISNLINSRISLYSVNSLWQFPLLSQYEDLLHGGQLFASHLREYCIPKAELNSILADSLAVVWSHQKIYGRSHRFFSYIRWKLKSEAYKKAIFENFFEKRIIPISSTEQLQ